MLVQVDGRSDNGRGLDMQIVHVFTNHYEVIDVCLNTGPTPFGFVSPAKVHWLGARFECMPMAFEIEGRAGRWQVRL